MSIIGKWSLKKKVLTFLCLFVVCAVSAGILYYIFKPEDGVKVSLATVYTDDVTQTLDATGTVESSNQGRFEILDNTKVRSVNVRVGDIIHRGDVLAAFDTASLQSLVADKQKAYESAAEAYFKYIETSKNSVKELVQVEKDIAALETEITKLEDKVADEKNGSSQNNSSTGTASFNNLKNLLSSFLGDSLTNNQINSLLNRLFSTGSSSSQIGSFLSSIINGGASGFDMSSLTGMSASESELTSSQLELLQLKAKQTALQAQTIDTVRTTYKTLYESAHDALVSTKAAVASLSKGWIAENDGIVREINITAGQVYKNTNKINTNIDINTLLNAISSNSEVTNMIKDYFKTTSDGMIVEYYPFIASFILGKYDVLKVSMDQDAIITSANGKKFNGKISYISPVASSSSSINISSLIGTSGSSSGVEAKVTIPSPDKSIIIGFDVDISIAVDSAKNVTVIPVEALQFDSENSYVFIYNEETNTVKKSIVETKIFSGSVYQVDKGCKVGDKIVKAPPLTLADGDKVVIQNNG